VSVPTAATSGSVVVTVSSIASNGANFTVTPVIISVSATTGMIGSQVVISGSGFGSSQGSEQVLLNGSSVPIGAWSASAVEINIPTGATSGPLLVSAAPNNNSNSVYFTVTANPLPAGWMDQDVGSTGAIGSATYSDGVFTIEGAGVEPARDDSFHFVYQPLPGDGTIIARVTNSSRSEFVAVMIRETMAANSSFVSALGGIGLLYRNGTGANSNEFSGPLNNAPYWLKLIRSGNSFSSYQSLNGVDWTQMGPTSTITMATNVYIGMAVDSGTVGTLATASFDSVSVTSAASVPPVISTVSATTGPVGTQVTISGSNFGATQGSGMVVLNDFPMTINSWSNTSISMTICSGATTGLLEVLAGPTMNASNAFTFTITSQPLPSGWLDTDIGSTGATGTAIYSNGTFTVNGAGIMSTQNDGFHLVYQNLSGDGTIVARLVTNQYNNFSGVMIRETTAQNSSYVSAEFSGRFAFYDRNGTGTVVSAQSGSGASLPCWLMLTRSGNTFTGYGSQDGKTWSQIGSSVTVSMATNVMIGLAETSNTGGTLNTATFDSVSVSTPAAPAPAISSVSTTTGSIGSQVTISGSNFGATQGSSVVLLSDYPMTVNSWSNTSISITISSGAASGLLEVLVGPSLNSSNAVTFTITSQPLPSPWLDTDIGSTGATGTATYSNGTFTVNGAGIMSSVTDSFHLAYQTLSGDGTIVARLVTNQYNDFSGVMIRETTAPNSSYVATQYDGKFIMDYRNGTGSQLSVQTGASITGPYWLMVTRSGNTFSSYGSPDGTYWTQVGSSQTISMATNVYIGLAQDSSATGTLNTATFDNVSVIAGTPNPMPNISSISPAYGGFGASVTINGSNFGSAQGSSSVLFNGVAAASVTSWSATQIVAVVPNTASTGPVTVIVNGLGSNKNVSFTLYNPVISSLTPPFGPVGGTITITGSGFGAYANGTTVQFNGVTANYDPTTWSDTNINATVPTGATSGPVAVTEGGVTSNSASFSVIEATTVSGLSPASGPVGASVVITGTGFGPTQSDSAVIFTDATATTITNWSDTSITAVVPSGALSGPISVVVAGQQVFGPNFNLASSVVLTDSLGNTTTYTSEVAGATWVGVQSQGSGCSTCSMRGNITNTFDLNGNLLTNTDPNGITTTYTYDSSNDLQTESRPLNSSTNATTTYTYNTFGEVLTMTDPLGNVTTNTYDSHGNLLTVTSPKPNSNTAASVTQFAYNSLGELTTITDPLGHVTTMTYTSAGLIATITDAKGNVTTYGYDAKGDRTSVTDALSHTTNFTYDAMSRLTQITYPDSTTSSFTYDIRGRRTSATDQNGKTTSYAYDDADRLTSVTDAASHTTYYAYDTEDNLTSITDANSNQTAFTYDAFGRATKTTFPSSLSETYEYDGDNNVTQKTDRNGNTIQYLYDQLNRLTQKTYPDTTTVDYTYDLVGKVLQVNDPTGTYALAYDNMGRLIGTTTSYNFLMGRNFATSYTYDEASNRTGFIDPEGGSTAYAYDTLNRLTSLVPPSAFGSGAFGFSYDALSRRTQMTRPNSVTTNYAYDNVSNLTSVLHQLSGSTIDGASYTLDAAGNRTSKTDYLAGVTSNYTYDPIYELTQVMQGNNATESYSYDAVENRTASLGVPSYTVNASNELTATSNATYTYDSNGNTLTKTAGSNTTTYAWNFENQMTGVTLPGGGTVTFKYDPFGRRIYKSSSSGTTIFAYDEDTLVETVNSSGAVVSRYLSSDEVDEPLEESTSGAAGFFEEDGLGSISSLTNSSASVLNSYTYDSLGNLMHSSGSASNPFGYTGREFDPETGLYYYRARYYDPSSGRFTSEDPLLFGGGGSNFYSYVENEPVDETDPFGMSRHCKYGGHCGKFTLGWPHTDVLPPDAVQYTAPAGQTFWIPPSADWCKEFAEARQHFWSYDAAKGAIGQAGPFDYQRDPTTHQQYGKYEDGANFSVGVYMNGAGFPRIVTIVGGLAYAARNASNFSYDRALYWIKWWGAGWDAANSGAYSKSRCKCQE
jgi:RHS repeat-associated protein